MLDDVAAYQRVFRFPVADYYADLGFEEASPIQAAAIPVLMRGVDVVGQSQTGSGKTAAFALTLSTEQRQDENRVMALENALKNLSRQAIIEDEQLLGELNAARAAVSQAEAVGAEARERAAVLAGKLESEQSHSAALAALLARLNLVAGSEGEGGEPSA